MFNGQYHNHVLTGERVLIFIVKFDYEPSKFTV